ncbi:MAG TPA: hypothetical protein VJ123_07180 [Anaerolineales bacterium]|nr:hypothetical protein [Anaerolineales bacterium]
MIQNGPADTFRYMVLGFAVILASIAAFLASLAVRFRNLGRDLDLLQEMETKEEG